MERETNTKIAIRGKGSVKEGAKGRQVMKGLDDENDDLHVFIQGDTEEDVSVD
jgi:splicing factor 1